MLNIANQTEQEVFNQIKEIHNNLDIINKPELTEELEKAIKNAISHAKFIGSDNDLKIIYQQLVFYNTETNYPTQEDLDIMATILFDLPFTEFHKTPEEKHLLSKSTVGGTPLVYFASDDSPLCADCATKEHKEEHNIYNVQPYLEGDPIICEVCANEIPSAYGNPYEE